MNLLKSNFTHRNTKFALQEKTRRACFLNQWSLNYRGMQYMLERGKGMRKLRTVGLEQNKGYK